MKKSGRAKKTTSSATAILRQRYISGRPKQEEQLALEREKSDVAMGIYALRTAFGLTQEELAERVGTSTSVISRLEDADYDGHSLKMLRRIAAALDQRVEVRFVPDERSHAA